MFPERKFDVTPNVTFPVFDSDNVKDFFASDSIGNRAFAQNFGGYPRSDIALINEQQSLQVAQNLLNNLSEYQSDGSTSGLSDLEIMMSHKSKYCQTPSEKVRWIESQMQVYRDREAAKLAEKQAAEKQNPKIEFDSEES